MNKKEKQIRKDISDSILCWDEMIESEKDGLVGLIEGAYEEGKKEERERIRRWLYENGITHKECFIKIRDFLPLVERGTD